MPNYRKKRGLSIVSIPAQALKFDIETGCCRIPISRELSSDVNGDIWIPGGSSFKPYQIVELRILPRNRELYAEYVYEDGNDGATCLLALDHTQALGIDPGVDNWLSVVSTLGESFIIDGRKLKSINQRYNRAVAKIKEGKDQKYWDDQLAKLTEERNRTMRDAVNKTARFVVNHCLEHRIGNVIFGWGQGVKSEVNLGSRTNQNLYTPQRPQRIRDKGFILCRDSIT
nr:transposase [Scytonema sp. UIC 10036]